jgi:hypothetical protein
MTLIEPDHQQVEDIHIIDFKRLLELLANNCGEGGVVAEGPENQLAY